MSFSFLKTLFLFLSLLLLHACQPKVTAPAGRLLSGPMPGYSSHREVEIVLQAENSRSASITFHPEKDLANTRTIHLEAPPATPIGHQLYHFRPTLLIPGTTYVYNVSLDNTPLLTGETLRFQTIADWQFRAGPPDFRFITGSCNYLNDQPFDRPGKPYGQGIHILEHMAASGADFMLWLGDNVYYRPAEYSSASGMWYRYHKDFSAPEMQPLLRAMHHYAIWDDHDYGPNDSNRSFIHKRAALEVFKAHWGNPGYGEENNPGIYTNTIWSDCAFFLLDGRTYRDHPALDAKDHPGKSLFGPEQMDWLKQSLITQSKATFKFIVMGGQFLHDHNFESFKEYPEERKELLDFIAKHRISGVIFISGDRHFTELTKMPRPGDYPLYDLTSSPINSGIASIILKGGETNPFRVEGTLVTTQNYCSLEVSGQKEERKVTMRSFDKENNLRWTHEIYARDLVSKAAK